MDNIQGVSSVPYSGPPPEAETEGLAVPTETTDTPLQVIVSAVCTCSFSYVSSVIRVREEWEVGEWVGEREREKVSQFQGLNRTQNDIRGSKVACLTMS